MRTRFQLLLLLILFPLSISAQSDKGSRDQKKLEGKYYLSHPKLVLIDIHNSFTFSKDGTFTSETSGDLGPIDYGNGIYQLSNEKLILSYSEKDPIRSKVVIESEADSLKYDSVEFHFQFFDLETEMEVPATIFKYFEDKSKNKHFQANKNGICNILLPKGEQIHTYTISFLGYERIELGLKDDVSKTIKIGLARSLGKQIIGISSTYEIEKTAKNELRFSNGSQMIKAKK
jgi:hypothetical protein